MKIRSLLWAPTIALSWFWGLGFFYSIHVVLTYGWLGFVGFAAPNALGLGLFGWVVGRNKTSPDLIVKSLETDYSAAFLFYQIAAAGITIFGFVTYFWAPMFGAGGWIGGLLIVLIACAIGQRLPLPTTKRLHIVALLVALTAAAVLLDALWAAKPSGPPPLAAFDSRFYGLVLPTLIGFLLGPWLDLQQWQRAAAIHREGGSIAVAYAAGALVFLGLLTMNALLAAAAGGAGQIISSDGLAGAEGALAFSVARLASSAPGIGAAFTIWTALATAATVESSYTATRWFLVNKQARSMSPILAMIPPGVASSPIWLLAASMALAWEAQQANLSLMYLMLPFATLFLSPAACLVCEVLGGPRALDAAFAWLIGISAAIVFVLGYIPPNPLLLALAPLIGLIGAIPAITQWFRTQPGKPPALAASDSGAVADESRAFTGAEAAPATPVAAYGFDGQWFVMQTTPTYDDTNSVGNVYFANYVRWVGKARELFFNSCMPDFDLKTTTYYVLTRAFNHVFRKEAKEFDSIVVRIRIAGHNRKFVTLEHEIYDEGGGLLGSGEQSLMFVEVENSRLLDVPGDIIRGFLPYWPKESRYSQKTAALNR